LTVSSIVARAPSAPEQQILDVIEQWRAAAGRGDITTIAEFYTEDAQLFPPNTASVQGREKAAEIWRGMLSLPNVALKWEPTRIEATASGDLAYVVGTYSLAFNSEDGRQEGRGSYVAIWKKVGDSWKLAIDMINSEMPTT